MSEFIATAAMMLATFGLGMVGAWALAHIAVLDLRHGRRISERLRRKLDELDAVRERIARQREGR